MTNLDPYPWTLKARTGMYFPQGAPRFPKRPTGHPDGDPTFLPRAGYEQGSLRYPREVLTGQTMPTSPERRSTSMDDDIQQYLTPMDSEIAEPTDQEVAAFSRAWGAARDKVGRGIAPRGTKTRAGLRAAYAARKDRLREAYEQRTGFLPQAPGIGATYRWDGTQWHALATEQPAPLSPWDIIDAETDEQPAPLTPRDVLDAEYDDLPLMPKEVTDAVEKEMDEQAQRIKQVFIEGIKNESEILSAKITTTHLPAQRFDAPPARKNATRAEGWRTNIMSLLALRDISPENQALLTASINELAALAEAPEPVTDEDIYAERQHQISSGYSARHDDEHGIRHLLLWAIQYGKQHKSVESLALIRAALESMARKGQDI
jgi:hypothetical protein